MIRYDQISSNGLPVSLTLTIFLEFDESRNTQYVSDDDTLHVRIMKINTSYSMTK